MRFELSNQIKDPMTQLCATKSLQYNQYLVSYKQFFPHISTGINFAKQYYFVHKQQLLYVLILQYKGFMSTYPGYGPEPD